MYYNTSMIYMGMFGKVKNYINPCSLIIIYFGYSQMEREMIKIKNICSNVVLKARINVQAVLALSTLVFVAMFALNCTTAADSGSTTTPLAEDDITITLGETSYAPAIVRGTASTYELAEIVPLYEGQTELSFAVSGFAAGTLTYEVIPAITGVSFSTVEGEEGILKISDFLAEDISITITAVSEDLAVANTVFVISFAVRAEPLLSDITLSYEDASYASTAFSSIVIPLGFSSETFEYEVSVPASLMGGGFTVVGSTAVDGFTVVDAAATTVAADATTHSLTVGASAVNGAVVNNYNIKVNLEAPITVTRADNDDVLDVVNGTALSYSVAAKRVSETEDLVLNLAANTGFSLQDDLGVDIVTTVSYGINTDPSAGGNTYTQNVEDTNSWEYDDGAGVVSILSIDPATGTLTLPANEVGELSVTVGFVLDPGTADVDTDDITSSIAITSTHSVVLGKC